VNLTIAINCFDFRITFYFQETRYEREMFKFQENRSRQNNSVFLFCIFYIKRIHLIYTPSIFHGIYKYIYCHKFRIHTWWKLVTCDLFSLFVKGCQHILGAKSGFGNSRKWKHSCPTLAVSFVCFISFVVGIGKKSEVMDHFQCLS